MIKLKPSDKLESLPPYLFTRIHKLKLEAYAKKLDVIDLSIGNPDMPTPRHIVDCLCDTVKHHTRTHGYPQAKGMPKFRVSVANWMGRRFGVDLDFNSEILALIGSKEGIAHLCMAYLNPGDYVLVCDPAYPAHFNGVVIAGGRVYSMPLLEENDYLPNFSKIPVSIAKKAKIMLLNYPNNPTAAFVKDTSFWKEAIKYCKKYNILLVSDNAYSELTFGDAICNSIFEFSGAKDCAVEFHSFSKTFNMAGWRVGWCCGSKQLLYPLEKFKSFLDYGVPTFIQLAAVVALNSSQQCVREQAQIYERRMIKMVDGLNKLGWKTNKTQGTMYVWTSLPEKLKKEGSLSVAERLLKETGVAVSPGVGFGANGEGYVRISLVTHDKRFHDALLRIKKFTKMGNIL